MPDPGRELVDAPRRVRVDGDLFHGRLPAGPRPVLYVGRGAPGLPASRYANPHRVGKPCRTCGVVHDQAAAVTAYTADLAARPELVDDARAELAGADLACWCRTGGPCHGDVLVLIAAGADPAEALHRVLNVQPATAVPR